MGDSHDQLAIAQKAIEHIINADEETKNEIRKEQLKVGQQINKSMYNEAPVDESMQTPYGAPSPYAFILPVPDDSIGLIIGKRGDTIRKLQEKTKAQIQVALKPIPKSDQRYIFIEGSDDEYLHAKGLIEDIVEEHRRNIEGPMADEPRSSGPPMSRGPPGGMGSNPGMGSNTAPDMRDPIPSVGHGGPDPHDSAPEA